MSVHAKGTGWVVRWRENGANRSQLFDTKKDATAYDKELRKIRQQGDLADELRRRRVTVKDLVLQWVEHRAGSVSPSTFEAYARHYDVRVLPQLGAKRVAKLTPADIEQWVGWMRQRGDRDPTILKACTALQSALDVAIKDRLIDSNPVAQAKKPAQRRTRTPLLIKPESVERIRALMLADGRERDVVLLELLAYAGLRPESEAAPLPWRHVRDRSILIVDTKRGKERTVPLVAQLLDTLNQWRLRRGRPPADALVIPTGGDGVWSHDDWRNWQRRVFRPYAIRAGLPTDVRSRDLRGSFASLLVHEGRTIVEVARIMGHSPEQCLKDYAQVFDEADPTARRSAEQIIDDARQAAREWLQGDDETEATA